MVSLDSLNCGGCNNKLDYRKRECPHCGEDNGFPNVRHASLHHPALKERVKTLKEKYPEREEVFEKLMRLITNHGRVVINLKYDTALNLLESKESYVNKYQRLKSDAHEPDLENFQTRKLVDTQLFVGCYESLIFAALSVDRKGLTSYGDVTIVLKNDYIRKRTSFLEMNSYQFIKDFTVLDPNGRALVRTEIPGHRASWNYLEKLALAKLGESINPNTTEAEFPNEILFSDGDKATELFIEAQIYGKITAQTFEDISMTDVPKNTSSKNRQLKNKILKEKLNSYDSTS